jgi:hypothetical protein
MTHSRQFVRLLHLFSLFHHSILLCDFSFSSVPFVAVASDVNSWPISVKDYLSERKRRIQVTGGRDRTPPISIISNVESTFPSPSSDDFTPTYVQLESPTTESNQQQPEGLSNSASGLFPFPFIAVVSSGGLLSVFLILLVLYRKFEIHRLNEYRIVALLADQDEAFDVSLADEDFDLELSSTITLYSS